MIECVGVSVRYGAVRALDDVDLVVGEGELVALTGANGAGKSSLLKAVLGLAEVVGGDVRYRGRSVLGLSTQRRVREGVVLVPEGRELFSGMTVRENLVLGGVQWTGLRPAPHQPDLDRVLGLFPRLEDRLDQDAGTLSGGEQQMLALGRALMTRPRVLVCDEPSIGLAPLLVAQILQTLRSLCDDGTTILLAEQNASAALRIADRGYVLESGRVAVEGVAADLLEDPAVVAAYLGAAPDESGRRTGPA